ncbi:MAG: outer membrane protein assembly factor [Proteobacteria bacterium]|nr:outer membrane protein assembly factor [Pseudomonadota bacterium]
MATCCALSWMLTTQALAAPDPPAGNADVPAAPAATSPAPPPDAARAGAAAAPGATDATREDGQRQFRYQVTIDAPAPLVALIEGHVALVRWQSFEDMTRTLFDRIAREAVTESNQAAASLGWFSAHTDIVVDTSSSPVAVTLRVDTGPPTRIANVALDVTGPATTDAPVGTAAIRALRADWLLPTGETFTQANWDAAKSGAVERLSRNGYPAVTIAHSEAYVDPDAQTADLTLALASGPLFHFGDIKVVGLQRYPAWIVENFSTLKPGERYDATRLDEVVRRVAATGYFSSVHATIDTDPATADASPITVQVLEAPTRTVEFGVGYSTDTQFRANANYRNVDIDGNGLQFTADMRLEQLLQSGSLMLVWPPGSSHWVNSAQAQIERTDIENLVTQTAVVGARRTMVDQRDNWAYGAAMYFDDERPEGAPSDISHALYVDAVRTWRRTDELVAPTRGYNVQLQAGGGIPGASTRGFGRVIAQWAWWHPINRDWEWTARAEGGAVLAPSRDGIPSALLFRTGGDTTVRGYAYQSLGVKSGDAIVPGRYYAVASTEVTRWFSPLWGIATFVDAGNAADELHDLAPVAVGAGFGVRLRTPIGPFRIDVAYGDLSHSVRLHMSVGLSF